MPADLSNKRGEAHYGEQEFVYYRFTIDEVVLTEEILVIKKNTFGRRVSFSFLFLFCCCCYKRSLL